MTITLSSPPEGLFRLPSVFSPSDPSRFLFSPERVREEFGFVWVDSESLLEPLAVGLDASTSITDSLVEPEEAAVGLLARSLLRVDGREDAFPFPLGFDKASPESVFSLGG